MKTLTIRNGIPKVALEKIDSCIESAYGFLCSRYGYYFNDVDLIFTNTANTSRYYSRKKIAKIAIRTEWWTYDRVNCNLTAHGLKVGYDLGITTAIIHELTHHIQNLQKRKYSEVETTQNEIDYLLMTGPEWRKFLKGVK